MHSALALISLAAFAALAAGHDFLSEEKSHARSPVGVAITNVPFVGSMLRDSTSNIFTHRCAGTLINNRAMLTSARCVIGDAPNRWRFRLGSASTTSGGLVYTATTIVVHDFDEWSMMNDLAIVRTGTVINFNNNVRQATLAGPGYDVADYQPLVSVGWGYLGMPNWTPLQYDSLRRFQAWAINMNTCRSYYGTQGIYIQYSMICSGFVYLGPNSARDKCFGEPGGPLLHGSNTVVGIRSWAMSCTNANAPAVNTRVGSYINWITNNA